MKHIPTLMIACGSIVLAACGSTPEVRRWFDESCAALAKQNIPGGRLVAAELVAAGTVAAAPVPDHCLIRAKLNERMGIDGKPYAIGMELRLPKRWNRRFFFQGGDGTGRIEDADRAIAVLAMLAAVTCLLPRPLQPFPDDVALRTSMCVLLALLAWRHDRRLLALLFSAAGDAFLAIDGERVFVPGLASFLLTHAMSRSVARASVAAS